MIIIPKILKVTPDVMAQQLCSVQPMASEIGEIFTFKSVDGAFDNPQQGDLRHSFLDGWQRYYGTQWIPEALWVKIKLRGLK